MNRDPNAWLRLGKLIRGHRVRGGWTQAELAQRARVSTKSVVTAESGAMPTRMPPTLHRIADALGWPNHGVHAVLDGKDPDELLAPPTPEPTTGHTSGRAVAALRGAVEFSRVCAEMGADPAVIAQFDAAAEALLSSAMTARAAAPPRPQTSSSAAKQPPHHDRSPLSDRAIVDGVVRAFDEEQSKT